MSLSAEVIIDTYVAHLLAPPQQARLALFGEVWNSFEGWLKGELLWVMSEPNPPTPESGHVAHGRMPWKSLGEDKYEPQAIGVEYRALLEPQAERTRKRVDFWVSEPRKKALSHYVELKVAFNDSNSGKQLYSWLGDLDALGKLASTEKAGSGTAFLVAVGFEDDALKEWEDIANKQLPTGGRAAGHNTKRGNLFMPSGEPEYPTVRVDFVAAWL